MKKIPFGMVEANDDKVSLMVKSLRDIECNIIKLQDVKREVEDDLKRELIASGMIDFLKIDISKIKSAE